MRPWEALMESAGLPGPAVEPPASDARFPDGGSYRFEIPSVEGVAPLEAVIATADRLGVLIHRVSQGSGVMMLTDPEIDRMVALCAQHEIELCLFLGPRGSWDIGVSRLASAGGVGPRLRGRDQVGQALADARRAVDHGVRCLLVADEGMLWTLHRLRQDGVMPPDLRLKVSVLAGPANPASFRVIEALGADSINIPSDLTIAQVAELRAAGRAAIDFYVETPDDLGGVVRLRDAPELVRVGAPIYLKFGLRNSPAIYPVGQHLVAVATAMAEERVHRARLVLDLLAEAGLAGDASPAGARDIGPLSRFAPAGPPTEG
jgi:hypothetical protein